MCQGLEFMQPLISDMGQEDPKERPTIEAVVLRFDHICLNLSRSTLRKALIPNDKDPLIKFAKTIIHGFRHAGYILCQIPPIPIPST